MIAEVRATAQVLEFMAFVIKLGKRLTKEFIVMQVV